MSRGFVHKFQVITASSDDPLVDSDGNWEVETVTQQVRGRLGLSNEMMRNLTVPESFDLVALVPINTILSEPTVVRVPAGYERDAAPGDYIVAERQPAHAHVRLMCMRKQRDD